MATTQPTALPSNPTTDSEETPPTTSQQTQESVDTLTTNDSPATDSEGTDTEFRVPVTSETSIDLPAILRPSEPSNIGLIVGSATAGMVVIILILTVVIIVAVLHKKYGKAMKLELENEAVAVTANQAGGLTHQSKAGVEESDIYNYPKFDLTNSTIETKQNEAYAANTAITMERNQAYAMSIITEKNAAYKSVNSDEVVDEYDYI